jgi:DNA gyrase/topoisomerase IV subunit B
MSTNYTGEQIEVLRGLEAVRKRPGMYIGNTAERGLHQLVYEAVDNAVDEAMAGHAHTIQVILLADGSCSVEDDGRGIPIDMHAEERVPAVEVVMTILHAGAKFGKGGYKVSGGLHGVGISVVNALSEWMITEVKRDGFLWQMKFERGITVQKLKKIGKASGTGTRQWFKPDPEVFEVSEFHWDILQKRLRELAFLNRGLAITLRRSALANRCASARTSSMAGSSRSSNGSMEKRMRSTQLFRLMPSVTAWTSRWRCSIRTPTPTRFFPTRITSQRSKAGCTSKAFGKPLPTR